MSGQRYELARPLLAGERLLSCTDCGSYVNDQRVTSHDLFHRQLIRLEAVADGLIPDGD